MSVAAAFDVLALIRKAPRTEPQLVEITGMRKATIHRYIKLMRDEGHVRVGDHEYTGGRPNPIYEWQLSPHESPDATYVPKRTI